MKIVDSAFNQILIAPWAMFLSAGYEKETDDGYEKSTTVAGQPGFEKWNTPRKEGELNLVVAKRFLVSVEGDRLDRREAAPRLRRQGRFRKARRAREQGGCAREVVPAQSGRHRPLQTKAGAQRVVAVDQERVLAGDPGAAGNLRHDRRRGRRRACATTRAP